MNAALVCLLGLAVFSVGYFVYSRYLARHVFVLREGEVIDEFATLLNPSAPIPAEISELTGITGEMVADAARRSGGRSVHYQADLDGLPEAVAATLRPGDLCVTMGAGSVEVVGPRILNALREDASSTSDRAVAAEGGKHG